MKWNRIEATSSHVRADKAYTAPIIEVVEIIYKEIKNVNCDPLKNEIDIEIAIVRLFSHQKVNIADSIIQWHNVSSKQYKLCLTDMSELDVFEFTYICIYDLKKMTITNC